MLNKKQRLNINMQIEAAKEMEICHAWTITLKFICLNCNKIITVIREKLHLSTVQKCPDCNRKIKLR